MHHAGNYVAPHVPAVPFAMCVVRLVCRESAPRRLMNTARSIALLIAVATPTACVVSSDDGRGGRAAPASAACGSPMAGNWQAAPVGAATFEVNRATRGMT